MPYDTLKDFTPVVLVAELPTVLLVNPSVPANSIAELVAYAKRNPGKLNYSSSGFGSTNHLAAEVFKDELGLDIVHVPYQGGGEAMNALLGGQVQMLFITLPASLPHIKAGKVRALALTGAKRMDSLPDVPTVAETVLPGFDINLWIGVVAPAGTPPAVVDRINADFNKVLAMPSVKERITALGANIAGGTPAQFDAFIRRELQRWAKTIKPEMRVD
jgi:tripartite-type tricarboxylate transporter receptor subunit TctC